MRDFIRAHAPHPNQFRAEHFLMAMAYSAGAAFAHSTVGSALVAIGYLTVALWGMKS